MTWDECLALGATKLAACLGCSVSTAHTWIIRSGPADWLKPILAAHITKMHNKKLDGTPGKRSKKSGI